MPWRLLLAPPAAALLLAASGCGGGGGSLSRADLVTRADASCRTYNAGIAALKQPANAAGVPAYLDKAIARLRANRDRLAALKPPSASRADYAHLLAAVDETDAVAVDLRAAATKLDSTAISAASARGRTADAHVATAARRLGLAECAKG